MAHSDGSITISSSSSITFNQGGSKINLPNKAGTIALLDDVQGSGAGGGVELWEYSCKLRIVDESSGSNPNLATFRFNLITRDRGEDIRANTPTDFNALIDNWLEINPNDCEISCTGYYYTNRTKLLGLISMFGGINTDTNTYSAEFLNMETFISSINSALSFTRVQFNAKRIRQVVGTTATLATN